MGGCQSHKTKNQNQKTPKTQITEDNPQIESDIYPHEVVPKNCMGNLACGYQFNHDQFKIMPKDSKTNHKQNDNLNQIKKQYQKCAYFYREHNMDQAYRHKKKLVQLLYQAKTIRQAQQSINISQQQIQWMAQIQQLMKKIDGEYQDILVCQQAIEKGGWVLKSNKKGVKVSIRRQQDSTVGCLIESQIQTPFQILIAVLIQMDLYKQYIPFVKVSIQQKEVARNCRIGYSQNHIPFLSVRQAFFQGIGYNRLEQNGTLFLLTRSIHNREDLQKNLGYKCNPNKNFVQLEYKYFVLKYKPINKNKGHVTIAMNVNPKLDFLPMWALQKVSEDFGQDFLKNVLKASKKFSGSKWEQNVNKNPHLFNFFKNSISDYLSKQQNDK